MRARDDDTVPKRLHSYTARMEIRLANAEDAALIAAHRRAMFAEMRSADDATLDALERASIPWTEQRIREGRYLGWIAMDGELVAGSAGMLVLDWPPHPC
jgi:hypothetical protein